MISFSTYKEMKSWGSKVAASTLNESYRIQGKTVFLSHSSTDDDLVPGAIRILEGHGAAVYVDKRDPELPQTDFRAVADRLREAVKSCKKFVLLVTPNSKSSKWIPWELGLGDGHNTPRNVALFPSAEYSHEQKWSETEYLGLYPRIIWGNFDGQEPEWLVYDHVKNTARRLSDWIRGY